MGKFDGDQSIASGGTRTHTLCFPVWMLMPLQHRSRLLGSVYFPHPASLQQHFLVENSTPLRLVVSLRNGQPDGRCAEVAPRRFTMGDKRLSVES